MTYYIVTINDAYQEAYWSGPIGEKSNNHRNWLPLGWGGNSRPIAYKTMSGAERAKKVVLKKSKSIVCTDIIANPRTTYVVDGLNRKAIYKATGFAYYS